MGWIAAACSNAGIRLELPEVAFWGDLALVLELCRRFSFFGRGASGAFSARSRGAGISKRLGLLPKLLSFLLLFALPLLLSCSSGTALLPKQWVVAWGTSPQSAQPSAENPGGTEQSFRFLLIPTIDGRQEQIHFSNLFGTTPITIGAARLASGHGSWRGDQSQRTDAPLTFSWRLQHHGWLQGRRWSRMQ